MTEKYVYEEEIVKFWQEKDIYKKVQIKNENSKQFNHVDGPPYPTGEVHLGHLRNWTIKDTVLRFKRLQGYDVYARDGYDTHGLPVENKVQAKLGLKTVQELKDFGEENFVKECKKYTDDIIDEMAHVRERFGLWMDRNPYYTFHPEYMSMAWRFYKKADEKGLLYKSHKTVAWCPHDETTLSDYEIKDTYKEVVDPSIYVKFPVKEEFRKSTYPESVVIWTTTPWTLQSNMLVAVNPEFNYAYALVELNGKEEVLILAQSLVEKVIETLSKQNDIKFIEILKVVKGAELKGIKYNHIYLDETPSQAMFVKEGLNNIHSVVLADFVTLDEGEDVLDKLEKKGYKHSNTKDFGGEEKVKIESNGPQKQAKSEGTGLVHIAPGHGFDDYEVGRRQNVPIFCPVGPDGNMTEGKYKGMYFKDVDPIAIEYLREKGYLLVATEKKHRYPCCWRCKTPIVYRAAEQWWIKRSEYLNKNIEDNKNVRWFPNSAKVSFDNLMSGAGDWAISRQRYWGTPLPIFEDEDGNYEVFGSKDELEERIGRKLEDIHRDDLKNLEIVNKTSGKIMKAVPFIADVWFDSGCASFASHYGEGLTFDEILKKYYPMKWITESEDQVRGWFSSLMNVGQVVTDKAPYKEVLYYGFVMAKDGQKMSKSLGNGITGNECIDRFGADKTRYYLTTKRAPEEKINFDEDEFAIVDGFFNTLENLTKYMNSYLEEHDVKFPAINLQNLDVEDKWILYRLNKTIDTFTRHFENFRMNAAYKELEDFIVRDLSKTYLKIIKDRTSSRDDDLLVIFDEILKKVLIMLAPVIPFKVEQLYQQIKFNTKKESCFLEMMPEVDGLVIKEVESKKIDENFELVQDIIASVLNAREKAKIGVRWPLGEINVLLSDEKNLTVFEKLIKQLTNIKKIKYDLDGVEMSYVVKPNFAMIKQDFENVQDVIKAINMSKFYIGEDLKNGQITGNYEGVNLDLERHIIKEIELKGDMVSSDFKGGSVILHTTQDEILIEEGYLRELYRRVQDLRKELELEKQDEVTLSFAGSDSYFLELAQNWESSIKNKVGAKEILEKELVFKKEFEIKDKILVVSIEK